MTAPSWAKPNGVILNMVMRAILARKFHWHCMFKIAWIARHETYVFEELGGFRPWLWHVWQWMPDYIEFYPAQCDHCVEHWSMYA